MTTRSVLVLILCCFCATCLSLSGKAYFCRDPDTGKLYPVNSTWASTTFCGNYTCKIRRKLSPEAEIPLREYSINNNVVRTTNSRTTVENDESQQSKTPAQSTILTTSASPPEIIRAALSDATKLTTEKFNTIKTVIKLKDNRDIELAPILGAKPRQTDRFLSDSEIQAISKLLHNVKKSDLEAIVDIYNLAQDIYKEVDKVMVSDLQDVKQITGEDIDEKTGKTYWYEPLNRFNKVPNTETKQQPPNLYPNAASLPVIDSNTYFQGPLLKNDFGTLPYYYAMSNFQRQSSYVHPPKHPNEQEINDPQGTQPPKTNPIVTPYPQVYVRVANKPYSVENQKLIQPFLLPYPFTYMQHYNTTMDSQNLFNDKTKQNELIKTEVVYENGLSNHNEVEYQNQDTNSKLLKSMTEYNKGNKMYNDKTLLDTLFEHAKDIRRQEWQNGPLSLSILEDIRAHFEEKAKILKPFSLRKRVRLERVGKVKKLDELRRDTRSVEDEEDLILKEENFEVYIEKTTCHSDTDLGFYKMGNLSQTFPACCPQRIEENEDRR